MRGEDEQQGAVFSYVSAEQRIAAAKPHIWWGVSVENQKHGLPRIQDLHSTPAATKFLSIEPLLEDLGEVDLTDIDWVIVGGESGPGARPMLRDWVISIRRQCRLYGVPFFFKQWGGIRKKKAGRQLDGRTYDEMPSIISIETPPKRVAARSRTSSRPLLPYPATRIFISRQPWLLSFSRPADFSCHLGLASANLSP